MTAERVLHVAATSRPYTNGYTMRLASIVATQRDLGQKPAVVTSPFYPGRVPVDPEVEIDGVPHYRHVHPIESGARRGVTGWLHALRARRGVVGAVATVLEEELLMRSFGRRIRDVARRERAELIHVHTPYRCALPALRAGRSLRLPVVYEVRGNWEDTAVSDGLLADGGFGYRYIRRLESRSMRSADAVVALCQQLADEVVSRGVAADRVFVAPNGADLDRLRSADAAVVAGAEATRAALGTGPVLGYVGSLRPLEGVDLLLRAIARLRAGGRAVRGLVVGGGAGLESLRREAAALGLEGVVVFTGAVPSTDVGAYYDLIDVFVVSRPDVRVTRLVTPIKPLEAMGRGKAVVMSDLPSLRELGSDAGAAVYHRVGDAADLAARCAELLDDPARRAEFGRRAQTFVESQRTWSATLSVLPRAYERARASR
ncbi:MAG: glycosyltransferase family 4 protein [Planctomycetota bacterium]|nr:glycosyltransferase family 4 protein [Planctomycetota bacterium]